jgi:DNA-binding LacI/PurR family transcriptional regulator
VPNRAARTLVTRRTDTIVLIMYERPDTVFEDPFFANVLRGVNAAMSTTDLQLVLLHTRGDQQRERALRYVCNGHVDGALLISLHGDDPMPTAIAGAGIPMVAMGRPPSARRIDYVDADNVGGGREAVRHLVAAGRRQLATVAGPMDMSAGVDRLRGYVDETRAGELEDAAARITYGDFTEAAGYHGMKTLLEQTPGIDGVFVASDLMGMGALRALHDLGRRIPEDVAVVGFDDAPFASYADPPLTTIRQPVELLGREMVRLLLHRLSDLDGDPESVILPTELVVRSSA